MFPTMTRFGLDDLSVEDKLQLVQEIWDSIDEQSGAGLSSEQELELQRRITRHEADPKPGLSWDELKARVQGRI